VIRMDREELPDAWPPYCCGESGSASSFEAGPREPDATGVPPERRAPRR
jgi:hypothetical protein